MGGTEVDLWIGRHLRRLRQENSMSPESLASRIGVSVERLNLIECGTVRADAQELVSAARTFDTSLQNFFPDTIDTSERDDDAQNRLADIQLLLCVLAKRGQLEEAYRILWKLALS